MLYGHATARHAAKRGNVGANASGTAGAAQKSPGDRPVWQQPQRSTLDLDKHAVDATCRVNRCCMLRNQPPAARAAREAAPSAIDPSPTGGSGPGRWLGIQRTVTERSPSGPRSGCPLVPGASATPCETDQQSVMASSEPRVPPAGLSGGRDTAQRGSARQRVFTRPPPTAQYGVHGVDGKASVQHSDARGAARQGSKTSTGFSANQRRSSAAWR